jgi:hypothetical protein
MPSSGMLRRMALVRSDVSEERSASINKVTRISVLGKLIFLHSVLRLIVPTLFLAYRLFSP